MKVFLKTLNCFIVVFILLTYLSIIGIETNRFNNQIQSKLKEIDKKFFRIKSS